MTCRASRLVAVWWLVLRGAWAQRVSYFAYGSNTNPAVLTARRGVRPLASGRATLADHRLAFDLRGTGSEPAFAGVAPCRGSVVHGIVFSLAPGDWLRICATEAAGVAYRVRRVVVDLYGPADAARLRAAGGEVNEDATVDALTLVTNPGPWKISRESDEPIPSARYGELLRQGATQSNLDPAWIAQLEARLRGPSSR